MYETASGLPATEKVFYWNIEPSLSHWCPGLFRKQIGNCIDAWLVIVPCLPLHMCWHWHDPAQ